MKVVHVIAMMCCLGVVGVVHGTQTPNTQCSGRGSRTATQQVIDEQALAFIQDYPGDDLYERLSDQNDGSRYDYRAWMKKNKDNFLRKINPEEVIENQGRRVCLIFIPVGENCKPALGIISEKDVHRLRQLGSQFVPHKTISSRAFMVECVNRVMWLKWMRLEF